MGASSIYATEVKQARLEMAKSLGIDAGVNAEEESVSLRIESFTQGMGVDLIVECTGEPEPTASIPPIPFAASCFSSKTVQLSLLLPRASFFAAPASSAGVITLAGRLPSVRA